MELSQILDGTELKHEPAPATPEPAPAAPAPVTAAPAEPTPAAVPEAAAADRLRGPDGKFLPKEPAAAADAPPPPAPAAVKPTQADMSDKERALLAAAMDERNKRQALEKRIADLEGKKPVDEPAKTFWDDPDGALADSQKKTQDMIIRNKLDTTEVMARQRYPDFDEAIKVFGGIVTRTPGMQDQWIGAPDPAEFAYRVGKNYKTLEDAGSIDKLREKIEKETRIKVEGEFRKKEEDRVKIAASLPGSLSDVTGSNPTKTVWSGPTPLDAILHSK